MIEAVGDGTIDVIASGHDPRGPEDKRLPFADAEPGMAGAETLLPLTLTLVRDGVIDLGRAFELLAANPAFLRPAIGILSSTAALYMYLGTAPFLLAREHGLRPREVVGRREA